MRLKCLKTAAIMKFNMSNKLFSVNHYYAGMYVPAQCIITHREQTLSITSGSAIAEGPREALVSRNPATTKHLT